MKMVHCDFSSGSRKNGLFGAEIGGLGSRVNPPAGEEAAPAFGVGLGAFGSGGGSGSPLRPQAETVSARIAAATNAILRRLRDACPHPAKSELPASDDSIAESGVEAKAPAERPGKSQARRIFVRPVRLTDP
jgi:hypothetical protein